MILLFDKIDWKQFDHLCDMAAWREEPHGRVEVLVAAAVLKDVEDDLVVEGGTGEDKAGQDPPLHLPPPQLSF